MVVNVKEGCRLVDEEQFGPVVPIARFSDVSEVKAALKASWNGQQAAIFTQSTTGAAHLIDTLASIVGRININAQCGRSPDVVPFSGRRRSSMGTMSVTEALRSFSVETVVAYTASDPASKRITMGLDDCTEYLAPLNVTVE